MARLSSGEGLALLKRPLKFKRGDKGPFIVDIQAMFAKLGFDPGEPEGVFLAKTEDAVRVFQAEYGLPVTGIIDAKTLKFLYEEADPGGYPAALIGGEEMEHEEQGSLQEGFQHGAEDHGASHDEPENHEISDGGPENREISLGEPQNHQIRDGKPKDLRVSHRTGDLDEIAKDKETAAGEKAIADEESKAAGGPMDDQALAGHLGLVEGQGSSPDKEITGDEQPVMTLAEVRPDMATMATGATDNAIVISLSERALGLYQGNQLIRRYPVAIGKPSTPTPVGTHRVLEKVLYPGGGLGTRWIGFTYQMHGIHGTNRPEFIGQEVSNGCVRMHNANVEELYEMVSVGTPVVVIVAPVQSWSGLGKPTSQTGAGSGQAGTGPGQAGVGSGQAKKPGGLLDPSSPQPKDPTGTSEKPSPTGGAPSGSAQGRTYTVQPGDSIWAIARRFGTTVDAIVKVNGIRNPELIYPGEVLKMP